MSSSLTGAVGKNRVTRQGLLEQQTYFSDNQNLQLLALLKLLNPLFVCQKLLKRVLLHKLLLSYLQTELVLQGKYKIQF